MASLPLLFGGILLALWAYYLWLKKSTRSFVLPPGPWGLPVLGNAHQIVKNAPLKFFQWAKQYGKMYTIYLGNKPALVINDGLLIKQIFGMPASTGKFSSPLFDIVFDGHYGFAHTHGKVWEEQRKFFIKALRNCDFGKSSTLTPLILQELNQLCTEIKAEMGSQGKVYLNKINRVTNGNILLAIITGDRKEIKETCHLLQHWLDCFQNAANSGFAFYTWTKYIAPEWSGYRAFVQATNDVRRLLRKFFDNREKAGSYEQDIISVCLKHAHKMENKNSSFYGEEGMKHVFSSVVALLIAGTETTASTMSWIILYLVAYPDVQEKVRKEISNCVGDRDPKLEDRRRMPYTEAVIEESLRMSSIIAYGLIHELLEDTSFQEYKLPKGMLLIANIYHAHYDQNVWGDPESFRPERFLNKGDSSQGEKLGEKVTLRDYAVAFQPGKRVCPGEPLARDVLFLFVTKLLKTFTFCKEEGRIMDEYMEPEVGINLLPRNIAVVANVNK